MKNVINIINFIRGKDQRADFSLTESVKQQIFLMKKYDLPGTFLLQHDALIMPEYTDMLICLPYEQFEMGIWFEIEKSLVEAAGLKWRGEEEISFNPDPICNFSGSYTHSERECMIDVIFERFKKVFGYYPKSCGAWMIDVYSINYMAKKYNLDASCNCKDQWGTDGYTLWGGYWNAGYYPSKNNILCPANSIENQINLPVFRMLGSDPLYQYDLGMKFSEDGINNTECQPVASLEPVYGSSGASGDWVDWFIGEIFNGHCSTLGYAQAGQENSFGWEAMREGFEMQCKKFAAEMKKGNIKFEKLCETGAWFKHNFKITPPSSIAVLSDYIDKSENGARTVWYNCKNYRMNLYFEKQRFWIRDIFLFDENYKEKYLEEVNELHYYSFDNLPFIDGNRYSGGTTRAGIYLCDKNGNTVTDCKNIEVDSTDENNLKIMFHTAAGEVIISMTPERAEFLLPDDCIFKIKWAKNPLENGEKSVTEKMLYLLHNNFEYKVKISSGLFISRDNSFIDINPEAGKILFEFKNIEGIEKTE